MEESPAPTASPKVVRSRSQKAAPPPPPRRRSTGRGIVIGLVALAILAAIGGLGWVAYNQQQQLTQKQNELDRLAAEQPKPTPAPTPAPAPAPVVRNMETRGPFDSLVSPDGKWMLDVTDVQAKSTVVHSVTLRSLTAADDKVLKTVTEPVTTDQVITWRAAGWSVDGKKVFVVRCDCGGNSETNGPLKRDPAGNALYEIALDNPEPKLLLEVETDEPKAFGIYDVFGEKELVIYTQPGVERNSTDVFVSDLAGLTPKKIYTVTSGAALSGVANAFIHPDGTRVILATYSRRPSYALEAVDIIMASSTPVLGTPDEAWSLVRVKDAATVVISVPGATGADQELSLSLP